MLHLRSNKKKERKKFFLSKVLVFNDEKLWHMGKSYDSFCLKWILFSLSTMSPDHEGSRVIPSPGSFLPSALSRSPFSPHQAPCVHRHIQEGEKNKRSPEPTVRRRNCCTKTKQSTWHTMHSCCCTQDRRKCHFIKCVDDATHHNMKHVQHLQTLKNSKNLSSTHLLKTEWSLMTNPVFSH